MAKSSGILAYRFSDENIEFLLLKPGGPFYKNDTDGIWTIPKGEIENNEPEIDAAKREFEEETGFTIDSEIKLLGEFKLRKGKNLIVYLIESNFDLDQLKSKNFEMEYPKGSGQIQSFPEIEKGEWMKPKLAKSKIFPSQLSMLNEALKKLSTTKPKLH